MKGALLIVDMQRDLCYDARRKKKVLEILPQLKSLIDVFSWSGSPIFYAMFALSGDDPQFKRFGDQYCIQGTPGAEIIDELKPLRGTVITKTKHSAFYNTELDGRLRANAVDTLYLAGLQTHICIMTTAADASFRGYRTVALSDCVVSTKDKVRQDALDWIARYVGEVRRSDDAMMDVLNEQ